jgi:hypothetical protein
MIVSEQTCNFSTAPERKTAFAPSTSLVTLVIGVAGVHCAQADEIEKTKIASNRPKRIRGIVRDLQGSRREYHAQMPLNLAKPI